MKLFGRNIRMPWAPSSSTSETRSHFEPIGVPISKAFTVANGTAGDPMRYAIAVIDTLHGDGTLPNILIERVRLLDSSMGRFQGSVQISPICTYAEIVTAHEIAHVLDLYGFGFGTGFDTLKGVELMPVMDALRSSAAVQSLQMLHSELNVPYEDPAKEWKRQKRLGVVQYLLKPEECWARAYAQWVAQTSQDAVLMEQLTFLKSNLRFALLYYQWDEADFARIGKEIELVLRRKDWIK